MMFDMLAEQRLHAGPPYWSYTILRYSDARPMHACMPGHCKFVLPVQMIDLDLYVYSVVQEPK